MNNLPVELDQIHLGDCLEWLRGLPSESVDCVVSSPPYNIGIDRPEISVAQLAELVVGNSRQLFGYKGKVVRGNAQEADYLVDNPNRRCPVIDKARTQLAREYLSPFLS